MRGLKITILILLFFWYAVFLMHPINLVTADLGRHLKNGEMLLSGASEILKTNFYSYAYPDYPFINHHWGSGVIFYLIWKAAGFIGLHLFFIILSLAAFWLFFDMARKSAGLAVSGVISIFLIPLIAERAEIRPEVFSYFFAGIFFWILWHYKNNLISKKWLWALPVIMLFWVNAHVYFFVGFIILGVFWIFNIKKLSFVFLATIAASLINPFGYKLLSYPLQIWGNYGYRVVENQTIWFLQSYGIQNPNLILAEIAVALTALSFVALIFINREKFSFINFLIVAFFGAGALFALRNVSIFGLFALPILSANIGAALEKIRPTKEIKIGISVILAIFLLIILAFTHSEQLSGFGKLGLLPQTGAVAEFF